MVILLLENSPPMDYTHGLPSQRTGLDWHVTTLPLLVCSVLMSNPKFSWKF
ncbi:Uncharacterised protein [Yersinia enterocolitica]|nr:Uncharacterised protein [Yersinia enterocolitica]